MFSAFVKKKGKYPSLMIRFLYNSDSDVTLNLILTDFSTRFFLSYCNGRCIIEMLTRNIVRLPVKFKLKFRIH